MTAMNKNSYLETIQLAV